MKASEIQTLQNIIRDLHASVYKLKETFPQKKEGFTLDGRLVGDIGEVIAEHLFQIEIYEKVKEYYDAETTYRPIKKVQIKATFKDKLTYNHNPDYFIGIKMKQDGDFKVVYNGPGKYIGHKYSHRKGFGKQLLSFPIAKLLEISATIPDNERIRLKENIAVKEIYYAK